MVDDWGVGVRVPVGSRTFSSPCRPDRLWGPSGLLSNGCPEIFTRGKSNQGVKLTTLSSSTTDIIHLWSVFIISLLLVSSVILLWWACSIQESSEILFEEITWKPSYKQYNIKKKKPHRKGMWGCGLNSSDSEQGPVTSVNTVMNLWVLWKSVNFLTSWITISLSRRFLLHAA
jgi:hypothetical protein